ncbi:MAG: hypothetical protein AB1608_01390 [Thermoproteota archaeon]
MKLVWAVLILIVFSIIGISESFAQEPDISMEVVDGISITVVNGILNDFNWDKQRGAMNIKTAMENDGKIVLTIPKTIWHLADSECNPESPMILIRGHEAVFEEIITNHTRIIEINLSGGGHPIEIAYDHDNTSYTSQVTFGKFCAELENGNYLPPTKQSALGFKFHDVQCEDSLVRLLKINHHSVCVKQSSVIPLLDRGWATTNSFEITDGFFEHEIRNGKITTIKADLTHCGFIDLKIQPEDDGTITISIPKIIFDLYTNDKLDLGIIVLIDGQEVNYKVTDDESQRTFTINFEKGSKTIEIAKICLI